ncbi:MAG: hypothetical protein NWE93_10425 [Candidatus Bathyarchaeota archaeon]|nr:hypothetical protein [Candidatus Bathyarchaeota archaeon]
MRNQPKDRTVLIAIVIIGLVATLGITELYTLVIVPAFAPPPTLEQRYQAAIEDAMVARESEVSSNLTPILANNSNLVWMGEGENASVLMVTWTKYVSSYPVGANITTSWGETWVTAAPQIQTFFANNPADNVTLRAAQLLGLPANTSNTYFVEMWVKPDLLFRPSPDCEINDTTTQLCFPGTATDDYIDWFNSNIIYSYYPIRYPWTRMGYTYDWGSDASHVGLSEFIIKANSTVDVKSVTPTEQYLKAAV